MRTAAPYAAGDRVRALVRTHRGTTHGVPMRRQGARCFRSLATSGHWIASSPAIPSVPRRDHQHGPLRLRRQSEPSGADRTPARPADDRLPELQSALVGWSDEAGPGGGRSGSMRGHRQDVGGWTAELDDRVQHQPGLRDRGQQAG